MTVYTNLIVTAFPSLNRPVPTSPVSVNGYKYKSNNRLAFGLDQFHTQTYTHSHDGRLQATLVPQFHQFMFRSARFTPFLLIYYV